MSDTARALRDLDAKTLRAPWSLYQSLRDNGPVVHVPALQGWMITQHAHAVTVLRDTGTWSSDSVDGPLPDEHDRWLAELADVEPDLRELLEVPLQTLLALDPPAHDRLRKVLTRNLSAAQIQGLAPIVDVVVADLAPELITGEPVDAVLTFAEKLPLRVVGTLLGLPAPEQGEWRALAARANTSNPHLEDKGQLRDRLAAELGLMQRFRALLSSPASALADDLRGAVQNGELTLREAVGLCREVLVAGTESTGDLLASLLLIQPS
jgi:cytochrome P450